MRILTLEDEVSLLESIQEYLTKELYECDGTSSYYEASYRIKEYHYDCILLDITLPDGNGLKILEEVKSLQEAPTVIIISAKNSLDDKITGLDLGADDYLTKPFHLSELNARIKAVGRRKSSETNHLTISNVVFNIVNSQVWIEDQLLNFTKKEFDILFYLAENKGRVVSKSILVRYIWEDKINTEESFNFLFCQIKNIKRKLNDADANIYVRTVYGLGYQLLPKRKNDLQE